MSVDEIVKEFKLHQILRYLFSGGFFLLSVWYTSSCDNQIDIEDVFGLKDNQTALLLLALLSGSVTYVIHRAIIYPIVGRIALFFAKVTKYSKINKKDSCLSWLNPYKPLIIERDLDFFRWERRNSASKDIQSEFDEWAGQIQFLYCSALSILQGNLITIFILPSGELRFDGFLICIILFLFITGFLANYRFRLYELYYKEKLPV